MVSLFEPLQKELASYLSNDQVAKIQEAYLLAETAHKSQTRSSGEPYIHHPLAVAEILADMRMDAQSVIAALLHDVIEDCGISKVALTEQFGDEVAALVDGVTKLSMIQFESRAEAQAESFRKMLLAMANDIRVILIKLADRLHNMRTLGHLSLGRRERIARETLDIYAPIANRLGMRQAYDELEDLCFKALYPLRYRVMGEAVEQARETRKAVIENVEKTLSNTLEQARIKKFEVVWHKRHLYALYKRMQKNKITLSDTLDTYTFRITVSNVDECYRVLGLIHNVYKPFPRRFKDYIAIPKANGYQSLHTALFGPRGTLIEVQIRTFDMLKMADNGISAHWLYHSEAPVADQAQLRAKEWIKGLLEIQQSAGSSLEFIDNVKKDLFPDEVYVFTPRGEIMKMPKGSTAVDFAYAVHTDVGNRCVAVKIDRKLAPLSTRLYTGQTVNVLTSKTAKPNPAWLDFVVTGRARGKIRHFLKQQQQDESILLGRRLVENALTRVGCQFKKLPKENIQQLLKSLKLETQNDLFREVGLGNQYAQLVAERLTRSCELPNMKNELEQQPLLIKGTEGVVVNFASCCHPIPGDAIAGFLSAGKGLMIHHKDCRQVQHGQHNLEEMLPVRWEEKVQGEFDVELLLETIDGRGVYAGLALAVANGDANLSRINLDERNGQYSTITMVVTVKDTKQLEKVIARLSALDYVLEVKRVIE